MKQTAVEWLIIDVNENIAPLYIPKQVIEQAKAMEKEQIEEAYTNALTGSIDPRWVEIHKKQAEQYYNETFKSE